LSSAITKSGKKTVAVVDFTDLQGRVTEFGRFLAEEFSVALSADQSGFKVIDRTNLKTILQEHKLASTGVLTLRPLERWARSPGFRLWLRERSLPLATHCDFR
jgi:hypothetical protein